jgi:hypothetical protein
VHTRDKCLEWVLPLPSEVSEGDVASGIGRWVNRFVDDRERQFQLTPDGPVMKARVQVRVGAGVRAFWERPSACVSVRTCVSVWFLFVFSACGCTCAVGLASSRNSARVSPRVGRRCVPRWYRCAGTFAYVRVRVDVRVRGHGHWASSRPVPSFLECQWCMWWWGCCLLPVLLSSSSQTWGVLLGLQKPDNGRVWFLTVWLALSLVEGWAYAFVSGESSDLLRGRSMDRERQRDRAKDPLTDWLSE